MVELKKSNMNIYIYEYIYIYYIILYYIIYIYIYLYIPLYIYILVGGLEHDFYEFPYIGNNNPN